MFCKYAFGGKKEGLSIESERPCCLFSSMFHHLWEQYALVERDPQAKTSIWVIPILN